MVDCAPLTTRPCFRTWVNLGRGVPAVSEALLEQNTAVDFDGRPVRVFYSSNRDRAAAGRRPRTAMILLDISGSMNVRMSNGVSRFEVAKHAVDEFLGNLDPGLDRVAVVPFESHNVVPTIRAARFLAPEEARVRLGSIPQPSRGDTALYASIDAGLDLLEDQQRRQPSGDYQLIVITDGRDDLGRDPDPELRQHPVTLEALAARVDRSAVAIYPIGIGTAADTDMLSPLEMISIHNSHMVQEPDELVQVLDQARPAFATRLEIAFQSPYPAAGDLQGRSHRVRIRIGQPGQQLEDTAEWSPVEAMQAPQPRERCSAAEMQALGRLPLPDDYSTPIRQAATLAVFTCILLICWFLIPRLLWPESYAEELHRVDGGARWAATRQAPVARGPAPGAARQETDATYVLPNKPVDHPRLSRLR